MKPKPLKKGDTIRDNCTVRTNYKRLHRRNKQIGRTYGRLRYKGKVCETRL